MALRIKCKGPRANVAPAPTQLGLAASSTLTAMLKFHLHACPWALPVSALAFTCAVFPAGGLFLPFTLGVSLLPHSLPIGHLVFYLIAASSENLAQLFTCSLH